MSDHQPLPGSLGPVVGAREIAAQSECADAVVVIARGSQEQGRADGRSPVRKRYRRRRDASPLTYESALVLWR